MPEFSPVGGVTVATLDELIMSIEIEREQAVKRRERAQAAAKMILERATQEGRANLTPEEEADIKAESEKRDRANADIKGIDAKLERAKEARDAERAIEAAQAERKDTPAADRPERRHYDQVARIGNEKRTYNKDNCKRGGLFLRDVTRQFLYNDLHAAERLHRHMQEERVERGQYLEERAVGTGAFAGLVVPQYLTELFAPAASTLRPFADACNQHDLPPNGMSVNISRITTPTGAGLQASENTAVTEANMDDTLLTENVQTIAGQQTLSRQAIDRGTGIEDIVMDDLFRRYAAALDSTLINQATTGLSAAATPVTATDASPTGPELYSKILEAAAATEAALMGLAQPDLVVMHSRRWYWLQGQMTTQFPLFGSTLNQQNLGTNLQTRYGSGARATLPNGLVVITDNNIATNKGTGTNEDEVFVVSSDECHLWEDPNAPVFIRAEQAAAASLGVLLVLYGYFAYSFRRFPAAISKLSGTALVTPVF
jgi:HK97 family phage major capsid protein